MNEHFSKEEINQLPITMKCCYFLRKWPKNKTYKTIEEWAEEIGWNMFSIPITKQKETAAKEAQRLREFVLSIAASTGFRMLSTYRKLLTKKYLKLEELTVPGYYWWLPECFKDSPEDPGCWTIEYWHPEYLSGQKKGLYWGPLAPPVNTLTEKEEDPQKICP